MLSVGGLINEAPSDIVEMYNTTTCSWSLVSLLPFPAADMALATVLCEDLETEVIEDSLRFKGDVVMERQMRVLQPLADHFRWDEQRGTCDTSTNEKIHL